jgi:hypothetical protein
MVSLRATQSTRRRLRADRRSPRPAVGKQWDGGGTSAGPSIFTTARPPPVASEGPLFPSARCSSGAPRLPPGIRDPGDDRSGCASPAVSSSMTTGDGRPRTVAIDPSPRASPSIRHHVRRDSPTNFAVTNGINDLAERSRRNLWEATNRSKPDRPLKSSIDPCRAFYLRFRLSDRRPVPDAATLCLSFGSIKCRISLTPAKRRLGARPARSRLTGTSQQREGQIARLMIRLAR